MSTLSRILSRSRRAGGDAPQVEVRSDQATSASQFVRLADTFRRKGLYDEAIAVCLKGVAENPSYVSGHVALARAYQFSGDIAKAAACYERVVELAPDNIAGHLGLAEVYETGGRPCDASRHLRTAMDLGADGPDVRKWLERLVRVAGKPCDERSLSPQRVSPSVALRLLRKKRDKLEAYRDRILRHLGAESGGEGGG